MISSIKFIWCEFVVFLWLEGYLGSYSTTQALALGVTVYGIYVLEQVLDLNTWPYWIKDYIKSDVKTDSKHWPINQFSTNDQQIKVTVSTLSTSQLSLMIGLRGWKL